MKANVHPVWFNDAKVTCVCGNSFTTGSTQQQIKVEICSNCHPLYTGQQKFIDTQGQVEKFQKIQSVAQTKIVERAKILENRASKVKPDSGEKLSLRDLLTQARKKNAA